MDVLTAWDVRSRFLDSDSAGGSTVTKSCIFMTGCLNSRTTKSMKFREGRKIPLAQSGRERECCVDRIKVKLEVSKDSDFNPTLVEERVGAVGDCLVWEELNRNTIPAAGQYRL